jgi:hypothetical protein
MSDTAQLLADDEDDNDTDMVVASNCSPQAPHPTQRPQAILPTNQPPTSVPTTIWRPPPLRLQTILMPSQPPRLLPPAISTPSSRTIRPWAPPPTSLQTLLFIPPVTFVTSHDLSCIDTTWFLHIHQLRLHVTTSLSLTMTVTNALNTSYQYLPAW